MTSQALDRHDPSTTPPRPIHYPDHPTGSPCSCHPDGRYDCPTCDQPIGCVCAGLEEDECDGHHATADPSPEAEPPASPQPDDPGPAPTFHLNEYRIRRRFGGPEEGGWYFDTGTFIRCHGTFPSRDSATAARDAKTDWLASRRAGLHPPSDARSTLSTAGWPELRIEPRPGRDFPAERPRYE